MAVENLQPALEELDSRIDALEDQVVLAAKGALRRNCSVSSATSLIFAAG
jgi:hypothetical protein